MEIFANLESSLSIEREKANTLENENDKLKRELSRYKARGGLIPVEKSCKIISCFHVKYLTHHIYFTSF